MEKAKNPENHAFLEKPNRTLDCTLDSGFVFTGC